MGLFVLPTNDSLKEHLIAATYNLKLMYSNKERPYDHLKSFIKKNLEDGLIHLEEGRILPDPLRMIQSNRILYGFLVLEKADSNFLICDAFTGEVIFECSDYAAAETACKFYATVVQRNKDRHRNEKG